jgi:hypothetical protein
MNLSQTWNFTSDYENDYIYDPTKIVFNTTSATLANSGDMSFPYIINSEGIDYTLLTKIIASTSETTSGSQVRIQISNDSDNWYFYDGTIWSQSTLSGTDIISGSNLFSELTNSVFERFVYDIDAGKLFFKLYFINDGTQEIPYVNYINFTGNKYYTSIKEVRNLLEPFGLRQCDPITGLVNPLNDFLSDSRLKVLLSVADSYINNQTFTDFYLHRDEIEFHDGNGKDSLRTYNFPIKKITHVIMYNPLMQAMRTFLDFELIIHPEWGEIFLPPIYPAYMSDSPARSMFGNIFMHGKRNIEIQYDWGYNDTPDDIKDASIKYIGKQILQGYWANLTRGKSSQSFDGYSQSYQQKPFGGLIDSWDLEIKQTIQNRIKIYPRSI